MQIPLAQPEFSSYVTHAATLLAAQGWRLVRRDDDPAAPWHVITRKQHKWRVVQILSPTSTLAERQSARLELGDAARVPHAVGTMEQWLAHVRPDGYVTFGPYTLNAQRWASPHDTTGEVLIAQLANG
jgi:hypothetical protein